MYDIIDLKLDIVCTSVYKNSSEYLSRLIFEGGIIEILIDDKEVKL